MKDRLKTLVLAQSAALLLAGLPLFLAPGRFLGLFGWAPIDPILSRLLGGGLLSMAWMAYRQSRRIPNSGGAPSLGEGRAVYALLGCVALLRHLLFGSWPWYAWALLGAHAILLAVGAWGLLEGRRS